MGKTFFAEVLFFIEVIKKQWWILGEANEAVALGPSSKIAHTVSFRRRCFLEVIMKSGRKVGNNTRSIRGEDFFFLENTLILGEKVKDEMKALFLF